MAIETSVLIRQVFHLSLQQTEGFMSTLALILKANGADAAGSPRDWPIQTISQQPWRMNSAGNLQSFS